MIKFNRKVSVRICAFALVGKKRIAATRRFMKGDNNGKDNLITQNTAGSDGTVNVSDAAEIRGEENSPPAESAEKKAQGGGEIDLKYGSAREAAKGGVLGAFIGLAIIVPGVSGSAVAIMMKLYEKLLYALGNIFKKFKRCALFLLPIAAGIVVGFALGFFGVKTLLDIMMFAVVALFAGLMAGAFPAVADEIKGEKHTPLRIALFAAGIAVPVAFSLIAVFAGGGTRSLEEPKAYEYIIYLALGFAVALTQLLPGLSATALLMSTGHYVPLMNSVSISYWQSNPEIFAIYACLIAGFIAGLLCFAKLMSLLLKRCRAATFHAVAGLALGSIITMFFNPEVYAEYQSWADGARFSVDLVLGAILFAAGVVVAYLFVRVQRKKGLPLAK